MSITLVAYPAGFLISPAKAKNEKVRIFEDKNQSSSSSTAIKKLHHIRVLTNLDYSGVRNAMMYIKDWNETSNGCFDFPDGLRVKWLVNGRACTAVVSGCSNSKKLQKCAEEYFSKLDEITGRNVRVIKGYEYFYYNYETDYTSGEDILSKLKNSSARNIYKGTDETVTAEIDGQEIKYYKQNNNDDRYMLETETRISIVNIGVNDGSDGAIYRNALQAWKIQTNIKSSELVQFLQKSGYSFYKANGQTPLRSVNATLNWYLEDGTYIAEFSGPNAQALKMEAEQLFKKMNISAGRDLRYIDEKSKVIYTYNTNYTDKGILINTLIEHGASGLTESGERISCRLFDMDMVYYKKDNYGAYVLDITRVLSISECQDIMNDLNEEYGLNIQEVTYHKIKDRLSRENMYLEDETVLPDNSIVLTIDVG